MPFEVLQENVTSSNLLKNLRYRPLARVGKGRPRSTAAFSLLAWGEDVIHRLCYAPEILRKTPRRAQEGALAQSLQPIPYTETVEREKPTDCR